jgi:phage/plasmid-like protein (TIGR03299 family)
MAHELEIRNGRASMMYVGETPWHGLGTRLDRAATSAEAIQAAGLDWEVVKLPLTAREGSTIHLVDRYAVVRSDLWGTKEVAVLGVVGPDYTPLQNRDAFAFFDDIVGEDAAIYHTAGALRNGERVWILAKLPSSIRVVGDDVVHKYLLLSNSHDGSSSVEVKFTPIRVVCQNTLSFALRWGSTVRVPHTRNVKERLAEAAKLLGIVEFTYAQAGTVFSSMARVPLDTATLERYLRRVFPTPRDESDTARVARAARDRDWARYFFEQGVGNQELRVRGTLWAAYNGVTEYVDHQGRYQSPDNRLASVWFGEGQRIKSRAFVAAMQMVPNAPPGVQTQKGVFAWAN